MQFFDLERIFTILNDVVICLVVAGNSCELRTGEACEGVQSKAVYDSECVTSSMMCVVKIYFRTPLKQNDRCLSGWMPFANVGLSAGSRMRKERSGTPDKNTNVTSSAEYGL